MESKAGSWAPAPERVADTWLWRGGAAGLAGVLFTGRGPSADRQQVLDRCWPMASKAPPATPVPPVAWTRQVHSAVVLAVTAPGEHGQGDALVAGAGAPDLALSVVSADCVPVLLAGPEGIAAVHAGWRGIVAGTIAATLARITRELPDGGRGGLTDGSGAQRGGSAGAGILARWRAWVGPAIGPCCYEVGADVAEQVVAASGPEVATAGPGGRPHLDLQAAARRQLAAAGVGGIDTLALCTRCRADRLYSFRREGRGAGRNIAFVWRSPRGARSNARS